MAVTTPKQMDQIRTMVNQGLSAAQMAPVLGLEIGEVVSVSQGGEAIRPGDPVETLATLTAEPVTTFNWSAAAPIEAPQGRVTPPTLPATATTFTNKADRDAIVTVTGGAVTVIAVAGVTTGRTSGAVVVPSGATIAITYTTAPTWSWVLI